jgi:hypothetical protein
MLAGERLGEMAAKGVQIALMEKIDGGSLQNVDRELEGDFTARGL